MTNVISAITNTVPVAQFNRGYAGKIFKEVKKSDTKAVMKNSAAECILLYPDPAAWIGNEQKAWNF